MNDILKENFIGFITEYDKNIRNGKSIQDYFVGNKIGLSKSIKHKVINYLKNGYIFGAEMSYQYDLKDNQPVGEAIYCTDGKYIWASYLPFYITKYGNYFIEESVINDLIHIDFHMPILSDSDLVNIDTLFSLEWAGKAS